jgi:hypothetical protein
LRSPFLLKEASCLIVAHDEQLDIGKQVDTSRHWQWYTEHLAYPAVF